MLTRFVRKWVGGSSQGERPKPALRPKATLRLEGLEARDTPSVVSDFWDVFTTTPGAGFVAIGEGIRDGGAMFANAATFHQIDSLNNYVNGVVDQGGGLYQVANVSMHVGAYALEAAGVLYVAVALGAPTAGIGVTTEGGTFANVHVSWAVSTESGLVWRGAYGAGEVLVEGATVPGLWTSLTGIPVLNSAAVAGAPAVTCFGGSICSTSAINAVLRGWYIPW